MDYEVGSAERVMGSMSKVVGLYQTLLRRQLEHFFPEAILEPAGDRSVIDLHGAADRANYRIADDPDSFGVEIDWFRSRFLFLPGSPAPFWPAERRLIEVIVRVLDLRFRSLFEPAVASRSEIFQHVLEDVIVTESLDLPEPIRITAALEALRVAALSTYENRRVSSGALLLGTTADPAAPERANPPGAPRYNVRLTAIKSLHRLCDGLRTLFVVDLAGDLAWVVDIERWAEQVHGSGPVLAPCPRPYWAHARATRDGGHACLVLSPSQEIKVFAGGTMAFAFSDARWRLLDIPTKFASWCQAVDGTRPADLAARLFQAALNLGENRTGALFVVLRDPARSLPQLLAPGDRIFEEVAVDDPHDPDNLSPRKAKKALHHLVLGQDLAGLDASVLESLAGLDGAVVTDRDGRLLAFGAILRTTPEAILAARAVEGARTVAALAASYHGPVLKVSQDGFLTMYLSGRRVWEL
jgi:DNA integrity scanning protein DisA with diadenylate cyclase activity